MATVLLLYPTASALAASVTEPGETVGLPNGTPTPPGFYLANQANYGCRSTTPQKRVYWPMSRSLLGRLPGRFSAADWCSWRPVMPRREHSQHDFRRRLGQSVCGRNTSLGSRAWLGFQLHAWRLL